MDSCGDQAALDCAPGWYWLSCLRCGSMKKEPFTMSSNQREVTRSARIRLGFGLLGFCLAAVPAAFAQYPTQSQVSKNGTTVMLVDYANPPLSNATHSGANAAAIDYK